MKINFVEELKWRGMVQDMMPGTEAALMKGVTAGYIGFDPTADSLHIGNLVQVMTLVHFQQAGHKPIVLVGGATGMVGDPSGKSQERNLLSEETLQHNLEAVKKQLNKFLDFGTSSNAAEMVNNYDWFKDFRFLDFIRDAGKHITISYMLAKDSVQSRLETGMSFTEFAYQLVQGYDFYWLYKNKNCKLQMGGSDQWGNIVTGTELIRRKDGGEAFALTTPLIKKADGAKFGKTEQGNIWLDAAKTSPYRFYQYWLNASDVDAAAFIKIFTLKQRDEIEALVASHNAAPHERKLQRELAREITCRVHSVGDCEQAIKASEVLFGDATADTLNQLSESTLLQITEGVPQAEASKTEWEKKPSTLDLLSVLTQHQIFPSKGEARKMIQAGGVSVNKEKVSDAHAPTTCIPLHGKYLLVQKGKKNYYLVIIK